MKIYLAGSYADGVYESLSAQLLPHELIHVESQSELDNVTDAQCIILRVLKADGSTIRRNKDLRSIIRWGVGYDSVDIRTAGECGVLVSNMPGANAYAVAELALGMMIMLSRRVGQYCTSMQNGHWQREDAYHFLPATLNGKTVGIIGGGNIGKRIARLVQALGAEAVYYDAFRLHPEQEEQLAMKYLSLDELLFCADIVTLHVPLLEGTYHMIGAAELSKMKEGSILINVARGGLVDDFALLAALNTGHLSGAGIDCVEDESSATTLELSTRADVLLTPHIGGTASDLATAMTKVAAAMIHRMEETGDTGNVVNREYLHHAVQ